jgi:hypothetical protein
MGFLESIDHTPQLYPDSCDLRLRGRFATRVHQPSGEMFGQPNLAIDNLKGIGLLRLLYPPWESPRL